MDPVDPKIQDLVEEYFKRPLTREESRRLSEWLAGSPVETQRFAQRLEILNSQGEGPGLSNDIRFKDMGRRQDPPWLRKIAIPLLLLAAVILYLKLSGPLSREKATGVGPHQEPTARGASTPSGPVSVYQARKSLPPPQISTPIPFKGMKDPSAKP